MPFAPSPSHHQFYRWYVHHSQSWVVYDIVLSTLMVYPPWEYEWYILISTIYTVVDNPLLVCFNHIKPIKISLKSRENLMKISNIRWWKSHSPFLSESAKPGGTPHRSHPGPGISHSPAARRTPRRGPRCKSRASAARSAPCRCLWVEIGHWNSGFTHWKWWIFPSFFVCLPEVYVHIYIYIYIYIYTHITCVYRYGYIHI